jgi:hypothetical protein
MDDLLRSFFQKVYEGRMYSYVYKKQFSIVQIKNYIKEKVEEKTSTLTNKSFEEILSVLNSYMNNILSDDYTKKNLIEPDQKFSFQKNELIQEINRIFYHIESFINFSKNPVIRRVPKRRSSAPYTREIKSFKRMSLE